MLNRKSFIQSTTALSLGTILGNSISSCSSKNQVFQGFEGKRLIIIQLNGGHDGLFALAPYSTESILSARPKLMKSACMDGVKLNADWVLNRNLSPLVDLWAKNELAFLPFVGYPNPNTSHFKSSEIWETGKLPHELNSQKLGWTNWAFEEDKKINIVSLHENPTLFDKRPNQSAFSWTGTGSFTPYLSDLEDLILSHKTPNLVKEKLSIILKECRLLNILPYSPSNSEFERQSFYSSQIIKHHLPYQIIHTTLGGFDTHLGQPDRLNKLYLQLSTGLISMKSELSREQWNNTLVIVYSEFGRTIDENSNQGTDHGSAGLSLLLSGDTELIKSMDSLDQQPIISELNRYSQFLQHQFDFRDLWGLGRDFIS